MQLNAGNGSMKVYLGKKQVDIKEVGSIIVELDDYDKMMIGSMSSRETKYGVSLVSKDSDKTYCAVIHGKLEAKVEETVSYETMKDLLSA